MRTLLVVLLVASCAGCLAGPTPEPSEGTEADDATPAPVTTTFTFGQPFGYDPSPLPMATEEPYFSRHDIGVPTGAHQVEVHLDWSCVSLCKIEGRLHAPDGTVVDRQTGVDGMTLRADAPVAGTWTFRWMAGEGVTVGVDGHGTATVAL